MLNIISNEYFKSDRMVTGPIKVFRNLIKGLDAINYPYVINAHPDSCEKLWIYNDNLAIKKIKTIDKRIKILLGPVFISDRLISREIKNILASRSKQIVCLQPSLWSKNMLVHFGYNHTPVEVWPVGIDTNDFKPEFSVNRQFVTIYYKQRSVSDLEAVKNILDIKKIDYRLLKYGQYHEDEYKNILKKSKYVIWVGIRESQGIALEEALALNVPILVWDVNRVGDWVPNQKDADLFTDEESNYTNTTSAPYFDNRCGIKFSNRDDLENKIMFMEDHFKEFSPREYVLENLSLAKQAVEFLNIFERYWNLKFEDGGVDEFLLKKKWKNEFFWKSLAKIYYLLKD